MVVLMELQECPHCSTRVVVMADGTCPACRDNFHNEPQPRQISTHPSREAAWEEFQQSLQESPDEGPLALVDQAEAVFAELCTSVITQLDDGIAIDTPAADQIRQELLPRFQAALDQINELPADLDASVLDYLEMRQESWRQLADALEQGDADALQRHTELWEYTELQRVELTSWGKPAPRQLVQDFQKVLVTFTPHLIATPAIVAINVLVFVVMVASGVDAFNPTAQSVEAWGADYGPKTMNGQWWRMATCMFLHFGILHLAFNMWVLWDPGKLVERLVGNVGFVILYFVCGLAGSIASLAWNPHVVSAGASGAVLGVAGALLGFMARRRDTIPHAVLKQVRGSLTAFLVYNLVFGAAAEEIDHAAHLGGLVAGVACGLLLSQPLSSQMLAHRPRRNMLLSAIGSAALLLACAALPDPPPDIDAEFEDVIKMEEDALETHRLLFRRLQRGAISDPEAAARIEHDILPPWQAAAPLGSPC